MTWKKTMVTVAWAVAGLGVIASPLAAQDRLLQNARDAATGAQVRLFQTPDGSRLEVVAPTITIRKQVVNETVVTALTNGADSLTIESGPTALSVSGAGRRIVVTSGDAATLVSAKRLVASSPLAKRATALIARMDFAGLPAIQPVLLTTRAFLMSAAGDESGTSALREWFRRLRLRTEVVKTGGAQKTTPTDCWKGYGDELLAAYDEMVDCIKNIKWWDPFLPIQRCEVIYEVRIIGASTWYASCVSLGGIIGK